MADLHRVVILEDGFCGPQAARVLARAPVHAALV